MSVREIRLFGDPVLKTVSDPIEPGDARARALIADLLDTVKLPGRAGVAACQIGVNLRAFSYNVDGTIGYLINPTIVELSGDIYDAGEGCLSVPGLWHDVERYPFARAVGVDLEGNSVEVSGTGVLAQALQHEVDHLDGLLYLDRLTPVRRREAMREVRESTWF